MLRVDQRASIVGMARRVDSWLLAGYAGVTGFLVLEATTRRSGDAATLDASADDAGTTRALALGYALAGLSAPLLQRWPPVRPLPRTVRPTGLVIQAAGLGLRVWAMRTLDSSYSRTLKVTNAQDVVARGPYRTIRHPGYLGSLLIWLGFSLTSGSPTVLAAVVGLLGPTYARRMEAEERLLSAELPGYVDYCDHTARLIPRVW
jgi:protein-S-isoprenylcysteine O-methyltransferase